MSAGGGKLVAADEPTVGPEPFLDAIVVEDGQSNGCFSNPPCTDENNRSEMLCEAKDLLDQVLASETSPRRRGR